MRVEQFELWASRARPPVIFWLSGFTFPTGFLTAVLQSSARQNNVSHVENVMGIGCWGHVFCSPLQGSSLTLTFDPQISVDSLSWEFIVSTVDDSNLVYPPKVGASCAWDSKQMWVWWRRVLRTKVGNDCLRREERGSRSGVLAIKGLSRLPLNLSPCLTRMVSGFEACTWRVLAGTGRTPAWWRQSPCSLSVSCPRSISGLQRAERRAPRVRQLPQTCLPHPSPILAPALLSQRLQGSDSSSFPSGMYSCPCYYYPNRAGSSDRASFVIGIDLRCGTMTSDHWIKRGTALLMSLDN